MLKYTPLAILLCGFATICQAQGVIRIVSEKGNSSGFFVRDNVVCGCAHACYKDEIVIVGNNLGRVIWKSNDSNDVAFIRTKIKGKPEKLRKNRFIDGRLIAHGFPKIAGKLRIREKIYGKFYHYTKSPIAGQNINMLTDEYHYGRTGMSGGFVKDEDDEVVGMISATWKEENVISCVPAFIILEKLKEIPNP